MIATTTSSVLSSHLHDADLPDRRVLNVENRIGIWQHARPQLSVRLRKRGARSLANRAQLAVGLLGETPARSEPPENEDRGAPAPHDLRGVVSKGTQNRGTGNSNPSGMTPTIEWVSSQLNLAPDDGRIGGEPRPPDVGANHHDRRRAGTFVVVENRTPRRGGTRAIRKPDAVISARRTGSMTPPGTIRFRLTVRKAPIASNECSSLRHCT